MQTRSRIGLNDDMMDVMTKMAEGSPGALSVCMQIMEDGKRIDPDGFMGGLGTILLMDTFQIYGPRIWMLYKDVCKQNLGHMLGLLRAVQLGFLGESKLHHAIDHYGEGVDLEALLKQVRERLPAFKG